MEMLYEFKNAGDSIVMTAVGATTPADRDAAIELFDSVLAARNAKVSRGALHQREEDARSARSLVGNVSPGTRVEFHDVVKGDLEV